MVLLCKLPNLSESDFSSVEIIACGAAPLSEKVQDVVLKRLNVKYVLQGQYEHILKNYRFAFRFLSGSGALEGF